MEISLERSRSYGHVPDHYFPGGSNEELFSSLNRLKTLPGSTVVLPGHNYGVTPTSTIQNETKTNPAMMAKNLAEFDAIE